MKTYSAYLKNVVGFLLGVAVFLTVPSCPVWAQGEVTSQIYRYRERVATGYYEGYEVSPRRARAVLETPGIKRPSFTFGSSSAMVRVRTRLPDSHAGLKFYYRSTCIECHPREALNLHSARAGITCRQCHGPEPIPSINAHFSGMNSIRRHAYVCARCHEGANAAFARFYVHEPPAASLETKKSFPILFYVYWGMLLLLVGTLAFFIPHSFMVGFRELLVEIDHVVPQSKKECLRESFKKMALFPHRLSISLRKLVKKKEARKGTGHLPDYFLWVRSVAVLLIGLAVRLRSGLFIIGRSILAVARRGSKPRLRSDLGHRPTEEKKADHADQAIQ